jgi:hypothetical protein
MGKREESLDVCCRETFKMISKERADEVWDKVMKAWQAKADGGKLDEKFLKQMKEFVYSLPDEDGMKRVTAMETGKTHLVPVEDIILKGLRGDMLGKYETVEQ